MVRLYNLTVWCTIFLLSLARIVTGCESPGRLRLVSEQSATVMGTLMNRAGQCLRSYIFLEDISVPTVEGDSAKTIATTTAGPDTAQQLLAILTNISPTATPTSIPEANAQIATFFAANQDPSTLLFNGVCQLLRNGLGPSNLSRAVSQLDSGTNNPSNLNLLPSLSHAIFPKKSAGDAPYSMSEKQLRAVIHIPSNFTYGLIHPLILMPGTGDRGGQNYAGNFIKLFSGSTFADPVWINPPGFQIEDSQVASEYLAYAVNYISSISNNANVSVLGWSQGGLNAQWAMKYWPSTRGIISDLIAISADFRGTSVANGAVQSGVGNVASIFQQSNGSNFVNALLAGNGDSAYVFTTTIYSANNDELVEPQQGIGASGYIHDTRHIGVSNNELQSVCKNWNANIFASHESLLYQGLTYALAKDALTHQGPASLARLDLEEICNQSAAPGLTLQDIISTESQICLGLYQVLSYQPRINSEPPLMAYAKAH